MSFIRKIYQRYLIDAMGAMAYGLFASLIIGLILSQLGKIPHLGFLAEFASVLGASSPVIGAAIGVAIAFGLKADPLVIYSSAATGALGYLATSSAGGATAGPVGAYLAAVIGAEIARLVSKKTPVDIVLTPMVTIIAGGLTAKFLAPSIGDFMTALGGVINRATELAPIPMGIAVAVLVGMALTAPISSAALCIMLGLNGVAAGAATVGCCAQMVGFAVASYRDNGFGGLLSQGLGTSMLQVPNILRRPQIWIAPTLAGAILGPIAAAVFHMTNTPAGAGMGTSGLVGQFGTWASMVTEGGANPIYVLILILGLQVIAPALLTFAFDWALYRVGWIKKGDMKLSRE